MVLISVGLVLPSNDAIQVYVMRILHFLDTKEGTGTSEYICFWYHTALYTIQKPSYIGKTTLLSIWYKDGIDPNFDSGTRRLS